jgi:hypothetical protein
MLVRIEFGNEEKSKWTARKESPLREEVITEKGAAVEEQLGR